MFIGADGIVQYKPTPTTATHLLTYERDINSLTVPENNEEITNVVQLIYTIDGTDYETEIVSDATSVSKYGSRETLLKRQDLKDETSAETYRDNYLNENKDLKQNIKVDVNTLYSIETIHP